MELKEILQGVMLFTGLTDEEIDQVAAICNQRTMKKGEVLAEQGSPGDEFYIVTSGFMEVSIRGKDEARAIVNLGRGQIIGEMSLVDHGPRSATIRAISDHASVQVIRRDQFEKLCEQNTHIGYIVMKDIAADMSFKLRHRNLMIG